MSVLLKNNMKIGHKTVEYQNWLADTGLKIGVDVGGGHVPCYR